MLAGRVEVDRSYGGDDLPHPLAAAEWDPAGVRVIALVPGWVLTKSMQTLRDDPSNEALWAAIPPIALRRWATEPEIARPALFLAGDASSYMTGQALFIDRGASLGIAH